MPKNIKDKKVESIDEIPTEVGNEAPKSADETTALKKECEEYKAGWMRAQADYQNLQKEIEARRGEWIKLSEAQILADFIPIYDNFKKAFNSNTDTRINADVADNADNEVIKRWNSWKKGIEYIMKQFGDVLTEYGIEEIKTVGEKFDSQLHEAMGEEAAEGKTAGEEVGEIIREVDAGYKVGDRVIKCAKVIVSR